MTEEGNGKRLTAAQKELLLAWIAEGCDSDEINKRARAQHPPFTIAKSTIAHYRKTRKISRSEITNQAEARAIAAGYATAAERIAHLAELAETLKNDLTAGGKLWLKRQKAIGPASQVQFIEEEEFNEAEIRQFRGLLEDIAKELGDRRANVKIDEEISIVWDLPVPGWEPPAQDSATSD